MIVTASVVSAGTSIETGSETYSPPAGIVTAGAPLNLTLRSVGGSMRCESADMARAMCTPVIVSGAAPKTFDMRTRTRLPPIDVRTSWRIVAFSSAAASFASSGICALAQLLTHFEGAAIRLAKGAEEDGPATSTTTAAKSVYKLNFDRSRTTPPT